jgi:hypothetical protein
MPPKYKIDEDVSPPNPPVAACKLKQDQFLSLEALAPPDLDEMRPN